MSEASELCLFSDLVPYPQSTILLMLYYITTIIIEVYLQCFTESVTLREIGNFTSRAEMGSPNYLYFKAVKGAQVGSALIKSFAVFVLTACFLFACT